MKAFEDPNHEGNSSKYHTGEKCIEPGCSEPAGTAWGKYWCFKHNIERIRKINDQVTDLLNKVSGPSA